MCHNLFEEIISLENLFLAWQEFRKGKRNKSDVQQFEFNLEDNVFALHQELTKRSYRHSHYTSFHIQDPKPRHIHKASVKDRVLHHAVFRVLYPLFDKTFIFDSYSCRLNKGTHRAVNRLHVFARKVSRNNTKNCSILKCDIKKFFDSIDQEVLICLISNKIKDKDTIWLIGQIIKSFSTLSNKGLPLGNITSQLFANIYLNELDQFIKHSLRIKHYIRYCDDFVILLADKIFLEKLIPQLDNFLKKRLKLHLHQDKIIIKKHHQGIDFLGYVDFSYHRILRVKTKRRMFRKIEQKDIGQSFNQAIQSYLGLLKHCNAYRVKKELLRTIYEKIKE